MPIYEYICDDCQTRFDALRAMRDADAPIECTHCQSEHTSRAISVFAAHSDGRVLAGGEPSCSSCNTHTCSTCASNPY